MKIWKAMAIPAVIAALAWALGCGTLMETGPGGAGADGGGGAGLDFGVMPPWDKDAGAHDGGGGGSDGGGTSDAAAGDSGVFDGGGFDGGASDSGASDGGTPDGGGPPGFPAAYGLVRPAADADGGAGFDAGNGDERAKSVVRPAAGGVTVAGRIDSISKGTWVLKLADTGAVEWEKTYAHDGWDHQTVEMKETSEGGYVVVGTGSSGGLWGVLVMRLLSDGTLAWGFVYLGAENTVGTSIDTTLDGGFIVGGEDQTGVVVLKLDATGAIEWQRRYAGADPGTLKRIRRTSDGGCLVAGALDSASDRLDAWIMKLDALGDVAWETRLVSGGAEEFTDAVESGDHFYAAGYSDGGPLVVRFDDTGAVIWQRSYGGGGYAQALQPLADGSLAVAGSIPGLPGDEGYDGWLIMLASDGTVRWQRRYGGPTDDRIAAIAPDGAGGFVLAGETYLDSAYGYDYWVFGISPAGGVPGGCAGYGVPTDAVPSLATLDAGDSLSAVSDTTAVPTGVAVTVTDTKATVTGRCVAP